MNREEIIEFLKENLSISIEKERCWDYDSQSTELKISLKLNGEEISYESVYLESKQ